MGLRRNEGPVECGKWKEDGVLVTGNLVIIRNTLVILHLTHTLTRPQAMRTLMRKRWSGIIRLHVILSEGGRIDPRGLGTQLVYNTNSRLDDAHEAPGHRRVNAEEVLAV